MIGKEGPTAGHHDGRVLAKATTSVTAWDRALSSDMMLGIADNDARRP